MKSPRAVISRYARAPYGKPKLNITPKGRKVREKALDFGEQLVEKMGLSAADFQNLREELVKLRTHLSGSEIGKS